MECKIMLKELLDEINRLKEADAAGKGRYVILFGRPLALELANFFSCPEEGAAFISALHDGHNCQVFGCQAVYLFRVNTFVVLKTSELSAIMMASLRS